jgi:hypothetical protein
MTVGLPGRQGLVLLIRWTVAAVIVVLAWRGGLAVWGPPRAGYASASPVFQYALIFLVGGPLVVVAGFLVGRAASAPWWLQVLAAAFLLLAVMTVGWFTSFVHFGGFCMDAMDACRMTWPARVGGAVVGLGVIAVGAGLDLLIERSRLGASSVA